MPAATTITIIEGHLRLGLTEADVVARDCQLVSGAVTATPNLQTVPATFCAPETQTPAATGWSLVITVLQDWTDPDGVCWFLFDHDTELAVWELALNDDEDAILNGTCRLVAASFGGAAGAPLQSDVTLPVQAKPTKGPLAPVAVATGATAGTPGTWTGGPAPASVAALQSASPAIVASPTTAWTTGQYVQTATAGVPGQAHWSSTAWVTGPAS